VTIHEAASCSSARDLPLPLQFAALTAARTDVLLHIAADNSGTVHRWPPPSPPQPYAVFVATNSGFRTLPLDFDASKGDPARDAIYTGGMLTECGIRYVTTTSGPTGGRHVLIPVVDPVQASDVRTIAIGVQSRCASLDVGPLTSWTAAIRPPLAPNRHGGRSELLIDGDEALDIFTTRNGPLALGDVVDLVYGSSVIASRGSLVSTPRCSFSPSSELRLSTRIRRLARYGAGLSDRYGGDHSAARFAVARACVEAGWSVAQFVMLITSGPMRMHHGKPAEDAYLEGEFARAQAKAASEPADERGGVAEWLTALESSTMAASHRALLRFVGRRAHQLGRPSFDLSTREAAGFLGYSQRTAARHIAAVCEAGWLNQVKEGALRGQRTDGSMGTLSPSYSLVIPTMAHIGTPQSVRSRVHPHACDGWV
jgi:hypothetical protein